MLLTTMTGAVVAGTVTEGFTKGRPSSGNCCMPGWANRVARAASKGDHSAFLIPRLGLKRPTSP